MKRRLLLILPWLLLALGCAKKSTDRGEAKQYYQLRGEVVRLRPGEMIAVIKHEKIDGWMEAMTMDFPVPDGKEFTKLAEGNRITATVQVNDLYFWLTDIHVLP